MKFSGTAIFVSLVLITNLFSQVKNVEKKFLLEKSNRTNSLSEISNQKLLQNNFPHWTKGIVWYQIFPERFANGDTANDPKAEQVFIRSEAPANWKISKWTSNWFFQEDWEKEIQKDLRNKVTLRRYGGDLQGVIDRLDYLKDLGVDAIYFNPIFESISMHKYDASNYHHIDANYGPDPEGDRKIMAQENPEDPSTWKMTSADKLFFKLVDEVHKRGMKIIIDGVFNHVGTEFWAFKDIAEKGKNSKYADWFIVKSFDDPATEENEFDYKGWWNIRAMPEFNRTKENLTEEPKQHIFAITKKWMDPNSDGDNSDGVDGWRLDVARDVPLGFWREWRNVVKSINPDAYIVGELWELSNDFVGKGDAFDALMNYNFAFAVNDFFIAQKNRIPVSAFIDSLKIIDETYPEQNLHILQNLIGSHDTDRLSSMIVNPDRKFDRDADERNLDYSPRKPEFEEYEKQKMIAAFQMTYRGAPMIYYGDEVGMWGADDPHDRKPMIWSDLNYDDEIIDSTSGFKTGHGKYKVEVNDDLLKFYKKLIDIRKNSDAIKKGNLKFVYQNNDKNSFAFKRTYSDGIKEEIVIAAFNLGNENDSFQFLTEGKVEELIEENEFEGSKKFKIDIPANSVRIYKYDFYHK